MNKNILASVSALLFTLGFAHSSFAMAKKLPVEHLQKRTGVYEKISGPGQGWCLGEKIEVKLETYADATSPMLRFNVIEESPNKKHNLLLLFEDINEGKQRRVTRIGYDYRVTEYLDAGGYEILQMDERGCGIVTWPGAPAAFTCTRWSRRHEVTFSGNLLGIQKISGFNVNCRFKKRATVDSMRDDK